MKITLDQKTLEQALINHLRGVGVTADILEVNFRYTRVPYTVFAEVEISEAKLRITKTPVEREVITPIPIALVDPETLPQEEPPDEEDTTLPSETPNTPLFGN